MSFGSLKILVAIFLAAYFAVGVWSHYSSPGQEDNYPFFSWFLFDKIPPRINTDFDIRFLEAGGQKFNPPIYFEKANRIYSTAHTGSEYARMIHDLGYSLQANDTQATQAIRKTLESTFIPPGIKYEVDQIRFDQIERFKSGAIQQATPLATFTAGVY